MRITHSSPAEAVAGEIGGATSLTGTPVTWRVRTQAALSGVFGTVAGIAPHVLHHIGPIAGAAIVTGTQGSVLFGAIGFALTVPLLLRLKRRFSSWLAPGVALALFALMFTVSTLWIGPAIRGENGGDGTTPNDPHHESSTVPVLVRVGEGSTPWM